MTYQAATYLGTTKRILEAWRYKGGGPAFMKLGGRQVRYMPSDLEAFKASGERVTQVAVSPNSYLRCGYLAVAASNSTTS
ncbi:MAG: helix-turn-helix domain-containing protein [Erythrobacter sp.]